MADKGYALRRWSGTNWDAHPLKRWDGTAWRWYALRRIGMPSGGGNSAPHPGIVVNNQTISAPVSSISRAAAETAPRNESFA